MDSDETTTATMMRSSTLSHRTGGGAAAAAAAAAAVQSHKNNHHDVENSSPSTTPIKNGHHSKTSNTLLPTASPMSGGDHGNGKLRPRRTTLALLQRLRLVLTTSTPHHRTTAYILLSSGLMATMLLVFLSSMSAQFHRQQSSSLSLSLPMSSSLSSYSRRNSIVEYSRPSSVVTLYQLPDYAGLPVPVLPHMYKKEEDDDKSNSNSNATLSIVQKWKPDYGGIDVRVMMADDDSHAVQARQAVMFRNRDDLRNSYMSKGDGDDKVSWYYITDDAVQRNPTLQFDDDTFVQEHKGEENRKDCRLNAWEHVVHENCNTFHELDFSGLMLQDKSQAIGYVHAVSVISTHTSCNVYQLTLSYFSHRTPLNTHYFGLFCFHRM
jgi:hypothetical protein